MSREQVVGHFQPRFGARSPRTHSHAWNGLVSAVGDLTAPELLADVRRAYDDGLVDVATACGFT
jgi:hypothetical protein